ncbi:hypothetical protein KC460_01160 [Candidatus Dependentiae bacterium]|nr:hypothetical protein [Candidatus Dependentiae bacterium]
MNKQHLLRMFSSAIGWNAFSYTTYKILYTGLLFLLYQRLTTDYFATWSNINSIIYILLLWIDFGFSKSIARFIPEFYCSTKDLNRFVSRMILFKLITLMCAVPLFFVITPTLCSYLGLLCIHHSFFQLGALVLVSHGITSTIKLVYHAHFWQKEFSLLSTLLLILETIINIMLFLYIARPDNLIIGIFITRIINSFITGILAFVFLKKKYRTCGKIQGKKINTNNLYKSFLMHSSFMWFSTSIKSLTERNIMVPLLTYTLGPLTANIFKVANDGALLFYRSVAQTIGTADTALLTHAMVHHHAQEHVLHTAFKTLVRQVLFLCFIAIAIVCPLLFVINGHTHKIRIIPLFILLTISYLIEAVLSPYERILEIKRAYKLLSLAYIPYTITIALFFYWYDKVLIGLFGTLVVIHGARLASSVSMVWLSYTILKKMKKQ